MEVDLQFLTPIPELIAQIKLLLKFMVKCRVLPFSKCFHPLFAIHIVTVNSDYTVAVTALQLALIQSLQTLPHGMLDIVNHMQTRHLEIFIAPFLAASPAAV